MVARVLTGLATAASVLAIGTGAPAAPPAGPPLLFATGSDVGGGSHVRGWTAGGAKLVQPDFMAYPTFAGGVRVAAGDVDGDGTAEIVTGPGPSGAGAVRVFGARNHDLAREVTAFAGQYGGVYVASADLSGDGNAEVVAGAAGGTSDIQVFDGASARRTASFETRFAEYGARVAAADVNGDGRAEIIAAPGNNSVGPPQVKLYRADGGNPCGCGFGLPFRILTPFTRDEMRDGLGGIPLAAGDVDGDGRAEIVVAGQSSYGLLVKVLDATTGATLASFRPYGEIGFESEVAVGDLDGDGRAEIAISAFTPDGSEVREYDGHGKLLGSFFSLDPDLAPRLSLAVADLDGDGKGEILAGGGPSYQPPVREQGVAIFDRTGRIESGFTAYESFFSGGVRVAVGNVRGDDTPEIVTASGPGRPVEIEVFDLHGERLEAFLPFGAQYEAGAYVAAGDLDGDRVCEIVVGAGEGSEPRLKVFDGSGRELASFRAFEAGFRGGVRVAAGDLEGDGAAEIVAGSGPGGSNQVVALDAHGNVLRSYAPFSTSLTNGVFVAAGDLDGNGGAEIVAGTDGSGKPALARVLDASTGAIRLTQPVAEAPVAAHVATGDIDEDGVDELIVATGSANGGPSSWVLVFPTHHRGFSFEADEPGGYVGSFVASPARVGPALLAKGMTIRPVEGRAFSGLVATFAVLAQRDTDAGLNAVISWGDGEVSAGTIESLGDGRFRVVGTHVYRDAGARPVVVRIWELHGRVVAASGLARVRAAAFIATGTGLTVRTGHRFTRFVATVRDGDRFTRPAELAATINWGDGMQSPGRIVQARPGMLRVIGRHRYPEPGSYRVAVHVRDVDGRRATARTAIRVSR